MYVIFLSALFAILLPLPLLTVFCSPLFFSFWYLLLFYLPLYFVQGKKEKKELFPKQWQDRDWIRLVSIKQKKSLWHDVAGYREPKSDSWKQKRTKEKYVTIIFFHKIPLKTVNNLHRKNNNKRKKPILIISLNGWLF